MSSDKTYFEPVDPRVHFPTLEEEVINYWKENKTFEKSVESRPSDKKWTFLDGPPFVTGMPHYGSLLSSLPKDVFPRYWTMKGYQVRRVWGWDGHGLPIENKVENKLQIKRKKDIEEKVGVKKFIEECLKYVDQVSDEWEWYVDRVGRWVDFKNAYKTWELPYMESVMWVFKQMYAKDYIYKGFRVSLYCPHCVTPISNFEVAMDADNYKEITEPANTYKYKVKGQDNTYFLAWSTTPWNKIATPALAVNPAIDYIKVAQGDEKYILAKSTLSKLKEEPAYKVIETFKGKELIGLEFEPHYDFYTIDPGKRAFIVIGGDFVTADEGTGIVTIAAYGEDDLAAMQKENIQIVLHVDEEGKLMPNVPQWAGMDYLEVNKLVNEDLAKRGLMYKEEEYTHTVPTCWRCHTRLFYSPQNAWYVNIQKLKPELKKNNEPVNWFPKHFKYGRFLKSMEAAPDWCISRSRYWGSPVPVWECECGERFVPGSIKELEEASGKKVTNLHKPEIDELVVKCKNCGKDTKRVPEVLDSWIEAGSASFAERHFPFEEGMQLQDFFPPDFIVEYTGQIRAWFYVLHVISTALYDSHAFKNVVVTGVILGTDGRKMSKNFGNYPDPKEMLGTYGGDALRLYLLGSPVMHGEDILISEEDYRNQVKNYLLILWNIYNFFISYANLDKWEPKANFNPTNVLDRWILSRMHRSIKTLEKKGYEKYNTPEVVSESYAFIVKDLSSWYVRRIRDRVGPQATNLEDKADAYQCLWTILTEYLKALAPLIPFVTEKVYRNLTKDESIHLKGWPEVNATLIDDKLEAEMDYARKIVEITHSQRKEKEIKVRQPLPLLETITPIALSEEVLGVIGSEVNVVKVVNKEGKEVSAKLDTTITPELRAMGEARELIRSIQEERKKMGTKLDEKVKVTLPSWPKEFEEDIKRKALIESLSTGEFAVLRIHE